MNALVVIVLRLARRLSGKLLASVTGNCVRGVDKIALGFPLVIHNAFHKYAVVPVPCEVVIEFHDIVVQARGQRRRKGVALEVEAIANRDGVGHRVLRKESIGVGAVNVGQQRVWPWTERTRRWRIAEAVRIHPLDLLRSQCLRQRRWKGSL